MAILFAYPNSLVYLYTYPKVLYLDYTYKINKYNMPLLDIVGVNVTRCSFCIAFTFLSSKIEEDYMWALLRLKTLYK
jgi:MULE transposase-like protein